MPVPTLFKDDYNRPNGSNVGVNYLEQQGDYEINTNELRTIGAVQHALSWKGEMPLADYRVEVKDVAGNQDGFGPAGRMTTGATPDFYCADFTATTTMRIRKRISSVYTTIASQTGVTRTAGKLIRLDIGPGTALRAWYDGVLKVSGTDAALTAKGSAGLFSDGLAAARYDDLGIYGDDEWTLTPNAYSMRWMYKNEVVGYDSGFDQRNEIWRRPILVMGLGYEVESDASKRSLQAFFHRHRGRSRAFLVKDPTLTSPTTEVFAVANGIDTKYKVLADWATAISTYTNGTLDSPQPAVDLFTGVVTYTTVPAKGAVLSADVTNAKYRVFFMEDSLDIDRRVPNFWRLRVTFIQEKTLLDGVSQ